VSPSGADVRPGSDCLFCRISGGAAEASIVVRTPAVTAFMDRNPVADGHVLVVPNDHHPSLGDLPGPVGEDLWRVTTAVAAVVRARLAPAVMLHLSDGEAADQDVPHVHLHVIPRHPGDAVEVVLPGRRPTRTQLDGMASDLARHLAPLTEHSGDTTRTMDG
jgi:histidine triad (HIT) family protein